MSLSARFEALFKTCRPTFLANDPIAFPRRFRRSDDVEIAAFLSAALSYGRAASIRRSLDDLFGRMPEGPGEFVRNFEPRRDARRLEGFVHRFHKGEDIARLCVVLRTMVDGSGTLERFFLEGFDEEDDDVGPALNEFCRRALTIDASCASRGKGTDPVAYFFPRPERGSACKRLCMFLRWVCRPDDGVDLGLWKGVLPSKLVIPLDTHVARISRLVGLTNRKASDWKTALEITAALRRIDPEDPVRFDFALAHLGISEGCTGRKGKACLSCPLADFCGAVKGD